MVGILFAVTAVAAVFAFNEWRTLKELELQLADLQRRQLQSAVEPPRVSPKKPYDASAREMLALATSDWPSMLTALESVEMIGVTPVSLELSAAEHWIRVEVDFSDYAKLLEYIDALNAGEPQPKWELVQAQTFSGTASRGGVGSTAPAAALAPSAATIRGRW